MQAVNTTWKPTNRINTPLAGTPSYVNSGIIKATMKTGDKISVGQIDYQEFDEENFQYVISPYWDIIDGLPPSIFQGIPGIDMDLRLKHYYRANYIPTFIAERTPSENREDLWELLESVGLDYYDRFEWLLRTTLNSANDNLTVERRKLTQSIKEYSSGILSTLQYGDRVIANSLETISDTAAGFADSMFKIVTTGIDVINEAGQVLIGSASRTVMISREIRQRVLSQQEKMLNRQKGISKAKKEGKYPGRKPIDIDMNVLRQVAKELDDGIITVSEAMKRTKIKSRSTFYRKLKKI